MDISCGRPDACGGKKGTAEAIRFIEEHKNKYHINMDNIILMGSSAGAIMTAQ